MTGLGATGAALAGWRGTASAQDEYDELRLRWAEMITGSGYDPAQEPFKTRLSVVGETATGHRDAMTPDADALWPDLPLGTSSHSVWVSFLRLSAMAQAYLLPGTGHSNDAAMRDAVIAGLEFMNTKPNAYTPTGSTYDNWWHWEIGAPQALTDTTVLMYDDLGADQISRYVAALDHFATGGSVSGTGANRSWICEVFAVRGVIGKAADKLVQARDGLPPAIAYVTEGDGFYRDGSFVQHAWYAYTGSYGNSLLTSVSALFALLVGSTWEITDPNRQVVFDSVENCFAPFIHDGLCMDGVAGRTISRSDEGDHLHGHEIMAGLLRLAYSAPDIDTATRWRSMLKGWLQRESSFPYLEDPQRTIGAIAEGHAVLTDSSIDPAPEPAGTRLFPRMDQAVHRGTDWAVSISMRSSRTAFYETINGENLHGWHTGVGMTYWWGRLAGNDQYTDGFWPTANPYRLPGTTVSRKPLGDGVGNNVRPTANWAGGTTDGEFGVVGQNVLALESTLTGRKSWFCLDDSVVCLGAAFSCQDGVSVDSTIDQRNLGENGNNAFRVDGVSKPTEPGWSETIDGATWAHLGNFGGYVFPGGVALSALREERTGSWRDITVGGSTDPITRRYLTMYVDHGTDPTDGSYAYVLLPGATPAQTEARANDADWLEILANDVNQQGVSVPSLGFTGVSFYFGGTVGPLTASESCSVLVHQSGNQATICVSDPRQNVATVTVTWAQPVAEVLSNDPTVTVDQTDPELVLTVDTSGSLGATHNATVRLA